MKRKGSSGEPVDTNGTKRRKREKKSDSDQELIKASFNLGHILLCEMPKHT